MIADSKRDSVCRARSAAGADKDGTAQPGPGGLFYEFHLDEAVPDDHLVRKIGAVLDLSWVYAELAPRAVRQAEVGAARTMLGRTEERFGLKPHRLAADSAYGSAPMRSWLVEAKQITPHIPVIDKSKREDGTFSREDFRYDEGADTYTCPAGKTLTTTGTLVNDDTTLLYRGSTTDCARAHSRGANASR